MRRILLQVRNEDNSIAFAAELKDLPEDVFVAPGETKISLAGVKTAIDFQLFREKEKAG